MTNYEPHTFVIDSKNDIEITTHYTPFMYWAVNFTHEDMYFEHKGVHEMPTQGGRPNKGANEMPIGDKANRVPYVTPDIDGYYRLPKAEISINVPHDYEPMTRETMVKLHLRCTGQHFHYEQLPTEGFTQTFNITPEMIKANQDMQSTFDTNSEIKALYNHLVYTHYNDTSHPKYSLPDFSKMPRNCPYCNSPITLIPEELCYTNTKSQTETQSLYTRYINDLIESFTTLYPNHNLILFATKKQIQYLPNIHILSEPIPTNQYINWYTPSLTDTTRWEKAPKPKALKLTYHPFQTLSHIKTIPIPGNNQ